MAEKKAALPREDVVQKLVDSHPSRLSSGQLGVNVGDCCSFVISNP